MKTQKSPDKTRKAASRQVPIRFEFVDPNASKVCVAGTFNQWNPQEKTLQRAADGHWLAEETLPVGIYEYCLVVDGKWIPDPNSKDFIPNPFGGMNSILEVRNQA